MNNHYSRTDIAPLFEYVETRSEHDIEFRNSVLASYARNARWSGLLMRSLVHISGLPLAPEKNQVRYFFWGDTFKDLILSLPRREVCILGGPYQLIFCIKHKVHFLPCMNPWRELYIALKKKDCYNIERLTRHIEKISRQLTAYSLSDTVLVVNNDSLPAQRTLVYASRLAEIDRSVCIQDGIFQSKTPGEHLHGWFADQFLAIDSRQRQIMITKGMNAKKIEVMGFHAIPYQPKRPISDSTNRRVCFLGQPWAKYGSVQGERYYELVRAVFYAIRDGGWKMAYKPHPWENGSENLPGMDRLDKWTLEDAFEWYDVFISVTSTALLEAEAAGRIAIQITDHDFEGDNFSHWSTIASIYRSDTNFADKLRAAITANITGKPSVQDPGRNFLTALKTTI